MADTSAAIECSLEKASLDDPPNYEALSYVWGDPTKTHSVAIDGKIVRVTKNLEVALRHLRLPRRHRKLWVDAVCIDQQNVDERDSQVLHMREIYQRCSIDLLWLGDDASILEKGAAVMDGIGTITELEESISASFSRGNNWEDKAPDDLLDEQFGNWTGTLNKLFREPQVWQRVWIMQEVSLAPRVVLVAGRATLPWERIDDFLDVDRHIAAYGFPDAFHRPFGHSWTLKGELNYCLARAQILAHQRRICAQQQQQSEKALTPYNYTATSSSSSLHNILARFRYCNATDPRDRIFALLNLSSNPLSLTPTYHDPVATVYTKTAAALINAAGNLDLLCQGPWILGTPSPTSQHPPRNPDLPSWVPDFANPGAFKILFAQRGIYNAAGEGPAPAHGEMVSSSSSSSSLPLPVKLTARGRAIQLYGWDAGKLAIVRRLCPAETTSSDRCERALAWMPDEVLETGIVAGNRSLEAFLKRGADEDPRALVEGGGSAAFPNGRRKELGRKLMGAEGSWGTFEAYWRTLMLDCTRYPVRRLREEDVRELRPKFAAWLMAPVGVEHSEWIQVELDSEGKVKRRQKKDLAKEARNTVSRNLVQVEDWVFAVLENGQYAMVPPEAEKGDQVAVLKGAKTPVVLRQVKRERGKKQGPWMEEWRFVGSCYVHGLMDGEVVTRELKLRGRQFYLT
ncbi:hypothetical protein SLS58_009403 [Diplodia intermedia]|uniref:Heterokaryon incompatibility domain-containing protein n=1 Tax=Diplodia intermedia TaxID=856260 RepID=A0ABR3TD20_9PEZI